jgi:hypothetical protein
LFHRGGCGCESGCGGCAAATTSCGGCDSGCGHGHNWFHRGGCGCESSCGGCDSGCGGHNFFGWFRGLCHRGGDCGCDGGGCGDGACCGNGGGTKVEPIPGKPAEKIPAKEMPKKQVQGIQGDNIPTINNIEQ